jgi:hypothetical protein
MGKIKKSAPVKLIVGLIFKKQDAFIQAKKILERQFGGIDFESKLLDFNHTDYYEKEFGKGLKRKFLSFEKLILPEALAKIKVQTNKIEERLSKRKIRQINLDPGYLDLARLVLASTKDYKHRLYLQCGIYAEVTLYYQGKKFQAWEWTYPDYKTKEYLAIFNQIRESYVRQIKNS